MAMMALYPGTFDPITNGHLDIIHRSLSIFDRVLVAVAVNVRKEPLFGTEERMDLIRAAVGPEPRLEVDAFQGLLVDYVRRRGARVVVRGLRAIADFEYEFQLAHMNRRLAPGVDTIFLPTTQENFYVSSSLVKEIASFGGDVSGVVPVAVNHALRARFPPATLPTP
ncbi:MAG: pantetheine-phosphate adenylyltransferase [Deltaproteobacteria bacterium]|nr:pantetheine-phosphate adenylyltransferase [Deltaproteobacteria bacterium]